MDERRQNFLKSMEIPEPKPHKNNNELGFSRSFSYSSSTFRRSGGEPVTRRTETFRGADGQIFSRTDKSIGDKSIVETVKGDETSRTLHNLSEGELDCFNKTVEQHSSRWAFPTWNQGDASAPHAMLPSVEPPRVDSGLSS